MSMTDEMNTLTIRYLQDKYPGKYDDITSEKLALQPYHKRIWTKWEAQAHYGLNHYYASLDKAPNGLPIISVTENGVINQYEWRNGRYEYL
jgi:hypothetical protein